MLAFGQAQDVSATAFSAIRRLRGGHTLTWQGSRLAIRQYWNGLPERPIRFGRDDDYLERYRELLNRAVADRVRGARVAVTLTGGLDSSSIAAAAVELQAARGYSNSVHAHTIAYDRLIPDRERYFGGLAARHLGVSASVMSADDYQLYERHGELAPTAEPSDQPFRRMLTDFYRGIAQTDRVLLMGLDGDTFLCEVASDYLLAQLRRGEVREYARGVRDYVGSRRELPPHRLRSTMRRLTRRTDRLPWAIAPSWLNPDIARRFHVAERWRSRRQSHDRLMPGWPLRPRATSVLGSPVWASMFDEHDAANLGALLEVRFPLADLALADFLMNISAVPWCIDKHIVRRAMAGRLPQEVLNRPKAPLAGDPVRARLDHGDRLPWAADWAPHPQLCRYVDLAKIQGLLARRSLEIHVGIDTRALMLNEWLWYHLPRSHANGPTADNNQAAHVTAET
jgi:asparagine synthase (glutamine-hydrolysing)